MGSPGAHKILFEPSKHLWWVWGLIRNAISPLLPSCWGFSFALGGGISVFGGIQHASISGCSAVSCNFEVLTGEDERTYFYSTVLCQKFQIRKGVHQGCILSQYLFNLYAKYIMQNARLDKAQSGIKIAGKNINMQMPPPQICR